MINSTKTGFAGALSLQAGIYFSKMASITD